MPGKKKRLKNKRRAIFKDVMMGLLARLEEHHLITPLEEGSSAMARFIVMASWMLGISTNNPPDSFNAKAIRLVVKDGHDDDAGIYLWLWNLDGKFTLAVVASDDHREDLRKLEATIRPLFAGLHVRFEIRRPADPDKWQSPAGPACDCRYYTATCSQ